MKIKILTGPDKGKIKSIIDVKEVKDTQVYITEDNTSYDIVDINRSFMIAEDETLTYGFDITQLGDPSLVAPSALKSIEVNSDDKPSAIIIPVDTPSSILNPIKEASNDIKVDKLITTMINKAKKEDINFKLSVDLNIPTKAFNTLLLGSFDIEEKDFIEVILHNLKMDLTEQLREKLTNWYDESAE